MEPADEEFGSGLTIAQFHKQLDKLWDLRVDYNTKMTAANNAKRAMKLQIEHIRNIAEADGTHGRVKTRKHTYEIPEPTWFAVVQDLTAFTKWAKRSAPGAVPGPSTRASKQMNALVRAAIDDSRPLPPGLGAQPRPTVKVFGLKEVKELGKEGEE